MGYPVPQEIPLKEDASFRGICVYVPNEPEYIRALMGSLDGLSSWVVWERDDKKSGSKSAELWKIANATTFANIASECGGEMAFDCELMKDCLIEVAKALSVQVEVNVNNSCTTGGNTVYCVNDDGDVVVNPPPVGDTPTQPVAPLPDTVPTEPIDIDSPEPPDNWVDWDEFDEDACAAANSLVDWAYRVFDHMNEVLTQDAFVFTAMIALIANFMLGGWALVFSTAMIIKLAELAWRLWENTEDVAEVFGDMRDDVAANRQELVCMLYENRNDSANWENQLISWLFTRSSGSMAETTHEPWYQDILNMLLPVNMAIGQLYGAFTYRLPSDMFVDCGSCVQSDGSWLAFVSNPSKGSYWVEEINLQKRLKGSALVFRNNEFSAGGWEGRQDFGDMRLDQSEPLSVNVSFGLQHHDPIDLRLEWRGAVGNVLREEMLVSGENLFDLDLGQPCKIITLRGIGFDRLDPVPRTLEFDAVFEFGLI